MITRRRLIVSLSAAGLAWPLGAFAQQRRVHRLGLLHTGNDLLLGAFLDAMRELGYVEGKTLALEVRSVRGKAELLPRMAAELVERNVDVIMAPTTLPAQAAMRATGSTPIVFAVAGDPVASGLVDTLAKPGRNVTGVTILSPQLASKRLQIFKEAFPSTARMGALSASDTTPAQVKAVERAAKALGITLVAESFERAEQLPEVENRLKRSRLDALYILESSIPFFNRALIADLALRAKLPTLAPTREYAEAGALMSYGVDYAANYRRAAVYVDKILKGAKPADLPVEQPVRYDLFVNARTAKALGTPIPRELLLRADKVIE
jgi:putative ABC transport system substrate-binding protein